VNSQLDYKAFGKLLFVNTLIIAHSVGLLVFSLFVVRSPGAFDWLRLEALQAVLLASLGFQQVFDSLSRDLCALANNSLLVIFVLSYGLYLSASGLGFRRLLSDAGCANLCRRLSHIYFLTLIVCIGIIVLLFVCCFIGARIPSLTPQTHLLIQVAVHGLPPFFSGGILDFVWVFFGVNSGYLLILQLALCRIFIGR